MTWQPATPTADEDFAVAFFAAQAAAAYRPNPETHAEAERQRRAWRERYGTDFPMVRDTSKER